MPEREHQHAYKHVGSLARGPAGPTGTELNGKRPDLQTRPLGLLAMILN